MRTPAALAFAALLCAPMLATAQSMTARPHGTGACGQGAFCKVDGIGTKSFDPDAIEVMSAAFADALRALGIDRDHWFAPSVARRTRKIFVARGERDPIKLRDLVLKSLHELETGPIQY